MIILGLLLLAAAVVAAVELIVANDNAQVTVHMWRWSWTVDAFWLAVAGAAILVAALLGLYLLKAGGRRERRMRRERRQLAKENRQLATRAELAEAEREPEPVRDAAPQAYAVPAETTRTPVATEPAREYAAAPGEQAYAREPVRDTAQQAHPVPAETTRTPVATEPVREYAAAPGEQAYAGEPVEGRHVDR